MERITRLGQAPDLPGACTVVLEQLLDHGAASPKQLSLKIAGAAGRKQELQVLAAWSGWDAFGADIIAQLRAEGLVKGAERCILGDKFTPGKALEVTPGVTVTVHDLPGREQREKAAALTASLSRFAAAARRSGVMNGAIQHHLTRIADELEGRRHNGRPPEPEDEPDFLKECKECGEEKPKTKDIWEVYLSRDEWWWRPRCRDCMSGHRP